MKHARTLGLITCLAAAAANEVGCGSAIAENGKATGGAANAGGMHGAGGAATGGGDQRSGGSPAGGGARGGSGARNSSGGPGASGGAAGLEPDATIADSGTVRDASKAGDATDRNSEASLDGSTGVLLGACPDFGIDESKLFPNQCGPEIQQSQQPSVIIPTRRGERIEFFELPRVIRHGQGFVALGAVEVLGEDGGLAVRDGLYQFDGSGNCISKLWTAPVVNSISLYFPAAAETRGGTTAVLCNCVIESRFSGSCGTELVIAGRAPIDLTPDPPSAGEVAQMGVDPAGNVLVASGVATGTDAGTELQLRLFGADGTLSKEVTRSAGSYLPLKVLADDAGQFLLLLQMPAGATTQLSRVVLLGPDLSEKASWDAPSDVTLYDFASRDTHVFVTGERYDPAPVSPTLGGYLTSLALPSLKEEWKTPAMFDRHAAVAVDVAPNGDPWVAGYTLEAYPNVWISHYAVANGTATTVISDPNTVQSPPESAAFWSLGVQSDGKLLLTDENLLSYCE